MSTALYRRYRPETFADVIGQEHVTGPLMAALDNGRVTHAYLFSGPRGCGKTTSARIFARCLNCAEGPTSTPCGTCDSCVELARGGAGSIDVVEMDAASHGGVDDARELRERAAFAPARDRYKVFIIDEAHMVSTQGFNALLKLVEEPPPHVKFVFATTEPEKVIGTIRSRTHHYPFRLVPPEQLTEYLSSLAEAEGIQVDSGVLPLVVRAGGGSVRDSLSVLDQLIAGTDDGTLGYERAVALLGFTHGTLLDDTVDALAARDGASLFRVVDRVIESGHAPRRFVEDLLERLRDLIVVRAAGEQAASVLRAVPADQLERMKTQASHLPAAALSRAADLVNEALTEMAGATSPRLQLELLCARLLLPSADDGADGFAARLEWLEGAVGSGQVGGGSGGAPVAPVEVPPTRPVVAQVPRQAGPAAPASSDDPADTAVTTEPAAAPAPADPAEPAAAPAPAEPAAADAGSTAEHEPPAVRTTAPASGTDSTSAADQAPAAGPEATAAAAPGATGPAGLSAPEVRRRWPEVLDTLARIKRTTWALISQDAQIVDLDTSTLRLGFSTSGLASAFRNGQHAEFLQRALVETLGLDVRIEPIVADGP
ncbi:MAG TPA: DNA polymerase III subunit gamma and tau, partial [Actinomycetaceae bacterium]|nr:DNA polymerase III subunit gamma and tau [Actinomycetaceae bacterium]